MVLDDRCFTIQQIAKSTGIVWFLFGLHCLGDKQTIWKMDPKNADTREQTEKSWHFQDTSGSLPD